MRHSIIAFIILAAAAFACTAGTREPSSGWTPPRTAWGDPDIQGQWNNQTSTPLQRPATGPLADRETISEEEAETIEAVVTIRLKRNAGQAVSL